MQFVKGKSPETQYATRPGARAKRREVALGRPGFEPGRVARMAEFKAIPRPTAEAELTLGAESTKNKLADKWGTDKSRRYAQQVISAESLEWPGARRGSSRNPFARCGGPQQP
jgi:hypothetical protein